jgi:CubicO group peptidase (beta-lactamase class C family)
MARPYRKFRSFITGYLLVATTLLVGDSQSANAGKPDDISARMRKFIAAGEISGAVTLVRHRGKVVHLAAVGKADIDNNQPMQADSLFAIASMTKPITATGLLILQDAGKLSVDDAVSKYLPEFSSVILNGKSPQRPITIRDLLTHTSGIGGGQQNQGSLQRTVALLAKEPMRFSPGEKWQYSPGLTVCGRVIEVVSGQPYHVFLKKHIFEPLKMVDTTFYPTAEQKKRIVRVYKPGKTKGTIEATDHWLTDLSDKRTPNPSGGLFSTAADMGRFYQAILDRGELDGKRIVSKKAVMQMTNLQTGKLVTGFTPGNGWGLDWCIVQKPQGVSRMLSQGTFGHGGLFGTQGWVDPELKTIFVLMIQRTQFGNADASDIRGNFQQLAVDFLNEP